MPLHTINFVLSSITLILFLSTISFLDDFKDAVEGELHDNRDEVVAKTKKIFVKKN